MATISKNLDIEIELDYDEISEAVNDLSFADKEQLIEDCELINEDIVLDYIRDNDLELDYDTISQSVQNLSTSSKIELVNECELIDEDVVQEFINNSTEEDVLRMVNDSPHKNILTAVNGTKEVVSKNPNLDEIDKKFMSIVRANLKNDDILKLTEKGNDLGNLLKGIVSMTKS